MIDTRQHIEQRVAALERRRSENTEDGRSGPNVPELTAEEKVRLDDVFGSIEPATRIDS